VTFGAELPLAMLPPPTCYSSVEGCSSFYRFLLGFGACFRFVALLVGNKVRFVQLLNDMHLPIQLLPLFFPYGDLPFPLAQPILITSE
jgi:hypothetical protein